MESLFLLTRVPSAEPNGSVYCACLGYKLRASDERTEPEAKSKAEADVLNRALEIGPRSY